MPGQNNKGKNGASVVNVPASTGIKTSPAAIRAAYCQHVSLPLAFNKYPVRIFNHHNGIIHNNPKPKQQGKQHHKI